MKNWVLILFIFAIAFPGVSTTTTLSVRDFGAMGDSKADDTAAFQKALDACNAGGGGTVFVPAGRYLMRGHLKLPEYVVLKGIFEAPPAVSETHGSTLLPVEGKDNANGEPFLYMMRGSGLHGIAIFYPEQDETIHPYPWTVRGYGDNISIVNVMMVNPYQAVDFGTQPAGRHYVNGLYAHALKTGIFVDKCFDVGRLENVHFWPFWGEKQMKWTLENGTAFIIARTDWEYMTNCFAISYKVGYHFISGDDGPGNALLTQCGSDMGPLAVKVDAVQAHAGAAFVNGQFMSGVDVSETNQGPLKFTNCGFWGYGKTDNHVTMRGGGHANFTNCHFAWWGQVNRQSPSIIAESGGLTVSGCEFLDAEKGKQHILLMEDVEAAIIRGNRFRVPAAIVNRSEGDVVIEDNVGGKPPKLIQGLESDNTHVIASSWVSRFENGSATSQSLALRLASAQGLAEGNYRAMRQKLLESVANAGDVTPQEKTFIKRAKDELKLDVGEKVEGTSMTAVAVSSAPKIDGKLDDAVWTTAPVSKWTAAEAGPATDVRVAWDDDNLYAAFRVEEPAMDKIKANARKHDGEAWKDDSIEMFIAPRRITHRYLQLIVNSAGTLYDGSGNLRETNARDWESSATVAASSEGKGWTAEIAVPWKSLDTTVPRDGNTWTADFRRWRFAGGKEEYSSWAKAPLKGFTHHPEAFGYVYFSKPQLEKEK